MNDKLVIVGMGVVFGPDGMLETFNRTVFDGDCHASSPLHDGGKKIPKGMEQRVKEAYQPSLEGSTPMSAPASFRAAADAALKDTTSRAPEAGWNGSALVVVSGGDDLHGPQPALERLIPETSLSRSLETAGGLLSAREVDCVVVGAVHPQSVSDNGSREEAGACAVVLKRFEQAKQDQDRVYAILDASAPGPNRSQQRTPPLDEEVSNACRKALGIAEVPPEEIGYIEVSTPGVEGKDPVELMGLVDAYQTRPGALRCALGNVKDNIGSVPGASRIAGLIKAALCLYHRYIPASPGWTGPSNRELWARSPFYIASESRPWFLAKGSTKRRAAVNLLEPNGVTHLVLSEDVSDQVRPNRYLALVSPYCFPLSGDDQTDLMRQLDSLQATLTGSPDLICYAKEGLVSFQKRPRARYALMIAGYSKEEVLKEIEWMRKGVPSSFEKGSEWKTTTGSYFTANPLGENGQLAYVYPGIGSAYVGLGQSMPHLFPELYERHTHMAPRMGELFREKELYPRRVECLNEDEIWKLELRLRKDIMAIAECGMAFFRIYTMIMRDIFKVEPHCALGYSMGEPGMMVSLGVWSDPVELIDRFSDSPTFRERLHGRLTAVREHWGIDEQSAGPGRKIWETYTLIASPDRVQEAVQDEEKVYLTIINTPGEVVIAGDPESCLRVIKKIKCKYYALGLDLAIHAEPTRLEHGRLVDLYNLPSTDVSGIRFYSSSCYRPIPPRSKAVANSIARAFCEPVDFPRLVNQSYADGARIFIELGSRAFCSNLISRILKGRDHLAVPINVRGVREQTAIVRVLAQLISHRIPVDLSPLL